MSPSAIVLRHIRQEMGKETDLVGSPPMHEPVSCNRETGKYGSIKPYSAQPTNHHYKPYT